MLGGAEVRACGERAPEELAFLELITSCERAERIGTASGCPDDPPLGSVLGSSVLEGDTTGKGDDVTLGCRPGIANVESADLMVRWQAPESGIYTFATGPRSTFSTQLGVLDGCGGIELACATSAGSSFRFVDLQLPLEAMQTVVIVVEGIHVTQTGYFELGITLDN